MQTILITGCSTGFGLEIAKTFLERDWNVVATMRTPDHSVLPPSSRLRILALDVTDAASIEQAIEAAGPLDAIVNNAGFGGAAPAETVPLATVRKIFETNTFGTMAVTQAVLPQFRERRAGVIVNVTSSVTYRGIPLLSAYRASKAAVNAYTESVALEMANFGVRAHLVLPGRAPETSFSATAFTNVDGLDAPAYSAIVEAVLAQLRTVGGPITTSIDVAEAVWQAVTDASSPLRIPAGDDAKEWAKAA